MRTRLRDAFGPAPVVRSFGYADAYLRAPERAMPVPLVPFWYREPGLWLPLSCSIAYVTGVDFGNAFSSTSLTGAINVGSGTGRLLIVGVGSTNSGRVSGVTYPKGGSPTALTQLGTEQANSGGTKFYTLWFMTNPDSGSNNVVISASPAPTFIYGAATCYTGASATGQPDAGGVAQNNTAGFDITLSITTVADSCWMMMLGGGNPDAAGTGTTNRITEGSEFKMGDHNADITPAGATSMTYTGFQTSGLAAAFIPVSSPTSLLFSNMNRLQALIAQ